MVKNSLESLKKLAADQSKNSLPDAESVMEAKEKSNRGRKAKPAGEKAAHPVTLKFTQSELDLLEKKSGLVPNATFLKQLLLTKAGLLD